MLIGYPYKLMPLMLIGVLCILALPWLGLLALALVAFVGLPALAFVVVWVPYRIVRAAVGVFRDGHHTARTQPAAAPSSTARLAFRNEQAA